MTQRKEFIEVGEFVTTHGITGELKLYPWCDGPEFVIALSRLFFSETGARETKLLAARAHKGMCLIKLAGVDSVEAARPYLRRTAYCARADVHLPEGRYFVQDLLGCAVRDADTGETYGTIADITHPATSDLYTVKSSSGEIHLFPAVPEFLVKIAPDDGFVSVRPIEGMFGKGEVNGDAD